MIEHRRIEAQILGEVYQVLKSRLGEGQAQALLTDAVSNSAIAQGRTMASAFDHEPTLADFSSLTKY